MEYPINTIVWLCGERGGMRLALDGYVLLAEAMAAFRAGTHHLILDEDNKREESSGATLVFCMPALMKPSELPDYSLALSRLTGTQTGSKATVPATNRCSLLGIMAAAHARTEEIAHAKKARQVPPPPIQMPAVPPGIAHLKMSYIKLKSVVTRQAFTLTARGHRLLLLEPAETVGFWNTHLLWEIRLVYPNYPTDAERAAGNAPVEGTQYTLVGKYRDSSDSCCGFGNVLGLGGKQGRLTIKLYALASLATTPAPGGNASGDDMFAVAPEIELAVLSYVYWYLVSFRKKAFMVLPWLLVVVIVFIVQLTKPSSSYDTPPGTID
ncbi:hypothetical protein H9P43_003489 [Blastocladiella emersonii ATCC 22665]|nr:hypothetical protein H9P43_003489 [Blastocladiella emersonii ATCC 22665]